MAFDYQISKAIDISVETDASGQRAIILDFKYVRFILRLDDKLKTEKLVEELTGKKRNEDKDKKVKMPNLYKR